MDKINECIKVVRQYMKEKYKSFPYDYCHETSILFKYLLDELEINCEVIEGKWNDFDHFWNKVNGTIIDLTIDQFDKVKYGFVNQEYYKKWYYERGKCDLSWIDDIQNEEDDEYRDGLKQSAKECFKKLMCN